MVVAEVRVVPTERGQWACRITQIDADLHQSLEQAVAHAAKIAAACGAEEIAIHHSDGHIEHRATT
ncbi:MAG TPA: DUF2188 domain-containing protein [Mycobacteriales bacterium]|nr:DUF2188 domain-containing protein [Mycobacteriales bacterium]